MSQVVQMIPHGRNEQARRLWLGVGEPCVLHGSIITVFLDREGDRLLGRLRIQRKPGIELELMWTNLGVWRTSWGVYRLMAIRWSSTGHPETVLVEVERPRRSCAKAN